MEKDSPVRSGESCPWYCLEATKSKSNNARYNVSIPGSMDRNKTMLKCSQVKTKQKHNKITKFIVNV